MNGIGRDIDFRKIMNNVKLTISSDQHVKKKKKKGDEIKRTKSKLIAITLENRYIK